MLLCMSAVSCADRKVYSLLHDLDDMVMNRQKIYEDYEMSLLPLKTGLTSAKSYSRKWELADSLRSAYRHFNMDSTLEYISLEHQYAVTPRQKYLSVMNEVNALAYRRNESLAEELFLSLDTTEIVREGLERQYLECGITLYNYFRLYSHYKPLEEVSSLVDRYRKRYMETDTLSYYGKRNLVLSMRDKGEYDKAENMLLRMAEEETLPHNLSSIYYNLAAIYGLTGDDDKRMEALVRSAEYDFRCPVRNYLSLYELALVLYDKGMLEKAGEYISANLSDAIAGDFNTRMINSGQSQMIISEASRHEDHVKMWWLFSMVCCFVLMSVVMCVLFVYNRRQAERLKTVRNLLLETDKIKDSYVFRYMELSIRYLEKIEETRRDIRAAGKSGGLEAIMKMLRSPAEIYDEYKRFYQIFDEAFLGIFPDFVPKVNSLLAEDARFPLHEEKVLCTELRMLAVMRLGITESGKIATFLKCSPATVYSYRSRLKRAAICPKDEFESIIFKL